MALNTIQQNLNPSDPSLIDLLNLFKKDIFLSLNCHHIGTIQSFDPSQQTASVTINYTKTFFEFNPQTGVYDSVVQNYPVSGECPVICLGGGGGALTFPIAKGDECLVLFNDRDMGNWFQGGAGSPNGTARLHSFADAIVLVGLRSIANVLTNYDMTRVALRNASDGSTVVGVGETLIKIANSTTTLNTLLQSLVTSIENLVTATAAITVTGVVSGGAVSGPPSNAATITAIGNDLTTLAGQISGLLE